MVKRPKQQSVVIGEKKTLAVIRLLMEFDVRERDKLYVYPDLKP